MAHKTSSLVIFWAACLSLVPLLALADTAPLAGDAYIVPGSATNYGNLPTINVGGSTSASGLLQFDLSSMPTTGQVAWARLRIFVGTVSTPGTLDLGAASAGWTEASVTGISGPGVGTPIASASVNSIGYVTFNVTSQVAAWLAGAPNYGFVLTADSGTPNLSISINAKENPSTSHVAVLEVVFSGPPGSAGMQGAQGIMGPTGAPGLPGPTGPTGAPGPARPGAIGAQGLAGAAGKMGPTGPVGATGASGAVGAFGLAGALGPTGPTGPVGPTGPSGAEGLAGAAGAAGPTGPSGPQGPAGSAGLLFSNVFSVSPSSGSYTIPDSTPLSVFFTSHGNTVYLPSAAAQTGRKIWIVMTDIGGGNFFTVASTASNIYTFGTCPASPCNGVSTVTFQTAAQFYSDGTRWNAAYTNQ